MDRKYENWYETFLDAMRNHKQYEPNPTPILSNLFLLHPCIHWWQELPCPWVTSRLRCVNSGSKVKCLWRSKAGDRTADPPIQRPPCSPLSQIFYFKIMVFFRQKNELSRCVWKSESIKKIVIPKWADLWMPSLTNENEIFHRALWLRAHRGERGLVSGLSLFADAHTVINERRRREEEHQGSSWKKNTTKCVLE